MADSNVATVWRALQLLSDGKLRAEHLAEDLGMTVRSVNRLLANLREAGIPLQSVPDGRMVWYQVLPGELYQQLSLASSGADYWLVEMMMTGLAKSDVSWTRIYSGRSEAIARRRAKEVWVNRGTSTPAKSFIRLYHVVRGCNVPEPLDF